MLKQALNNWKTTSAGLTMIAGAVVHLCFAVKGGTLNENGVTIAVGAILGGLGLIFAGDAGAPTPTTTNIAAAVDKINQTGPDSSAPPAQPVNPTTKP
jgi:hypothetical protein